MKDRAGDIIRAQICLLVFLVVFGGLRYYERTSPAGVTAEAEKDGDYIQWVDFDVTCEALKQAYKRDVESRGREVHLNWIDLLALLGVKYGGDFSKYKERDMEEAAADIEAQGIEKLTKDMKYYAYYREAYGAVLGGMVGSYEAEDETGGWKARSRRSAGTATAAGASASTALTENVIITMPTSGRTVPMPKGFRKEIWSRPETSSVIWGGRDTAPRKMSTISTSVTFIWDCSSFLTNPREKAIMRSGSMCILWFSFCPNTPPRF